MKGEERQSYQGIMIWTWTKCNLDGMWVTQVNVHLAPRYESHVIGAVFEDPRSRVSALAWAKDLIDEYLGNSLVVPEPAPEPAVHMPLLRGHIQPPYGGMPCENDRFYIENEAWI